MLPEGPVSNAPFERLRTLVLNASGATWQQVRCCAATVTRAAHRRYASGAFQVCRLQPVLPALVELHMCDCAITRLAGDGVFHRSLWLRRS